MSSKEFFFTFWISLDWHWLGLLSTFIGIYFRFPGWIHWFSQPGRRFMLHKVHWNIYWRVEVILTYTSGLRISFIKNMYWSIIQILPFQFIQSEWGAFYPVLLVYTPWSDILITQLCSMAGCNNIQIYLVQCQDHFPWSGFLLFMICTVYSIVWWNIVLGVS